MPESQSCTKNSRLNRNEFSQFDEGTSFTKTTKFSNSNDNNSSEASLFSDLIEKDMKPINKNISSPNKIAQNVGKTKFTANTVEYFKAFSSNFKENDADLKKKILLDEMCEDRNESRSETGETDTEHNNRKRQLAPIVNNKKSGNYERKRTANLENLIGNLKVRKMNQTTNKSVDMDTTGSSIEYSSDKMNSLYVDVIGGSSLSDGSPSTPPLSSPSISPSSISASPDSPIQSHASSVASSSSNLNTNSKLNIPQKFKWMMESTASNTHHESPIEEPASHESNVKDEPNSHYKSYVHQENLCSVFEANNEQAESKKVPKSNRNNQKQTKSCKIEKSIECGISPGSKSSQSSKNLDDPTRQIKFYDDFIDFRGDILCRPANSKNCRILWEYLYLLLQDNNYNGVIRWEDPIQMVFRIVQAEKLAALWGKSILIFAVIGKVNFYSFI